MTEKPILFSAPMIRAILEGRKSMTRRVVKPQPELNTAGLWVWPPEWTVAAIRKWGQAAQTDDAGMRTTFRSERVLSAMPYRPGAVLWVREAFAVREGGPIRDAAGGQMDYAETEVIYRATNPHGAIKWKPGIHMPRSYARITLRVTAVKVERLQDISEEDAEAEGVRGSEGGAWGREGLIEDFSNLWESIHGPGSWDANPWVWVIKFKRVEQ